MRDLIESVRAEHAKILQLADEVLALVQEDATGGERSARRAIDALVALESRHEAAEAMYVWPVVRDTLPEYAGIREVAQRQERQARRRLHRLRKMAGRPGSAALAAVVVREVVIHVGLEESQILPSLQSALSYNDSMRIARIYRRASAAGPSRPHPLVPAIPGVLSLTAPVAARADRVRDLLRVR